MSTVAPSQDRIETTRPQLDAAECVLVPFHIGNMNESKRISHPLRKVVQKPIGTSILVEMHCCACYIQEFV